MAAETPWRKKLIEVTIPLDPINRESAREKSIVHGHPSTLHIYWARRPLAACRAVIFCSLIDDPGEEGAPDDLLQLIDDLEEPRPLPAKWEDMNTAEQRRQKLFKFIETLVKWESTTDEDVIGTARELILAATEGNPPPLLDPFCGGGSIPLEAQRLGLEAHGSDLNPVAVLITKALIELPPRFAGMPPVNPDARTEIGSDAEWKGAAGLAEDVRWYGEWMRQRAWERIGHLYPQGPNGETVIAWLWARTTRCPNPACHADMPLVRSFQLSKRRGREAWAHPIANGTEVVFDVRDDRASNITGTVERTGATCLVCATTVPLKDVRERGRAHGLGSQMIGVVEEGGNRRIFRSPAHADETTADVPLPDNIPMTKLPTKALGFRVQNYGYQQWSDLFTARQLTALTVFSDLVDDARTLVRQHAADMGFGSESDGYADAIATYLAFAVDRSANAWSSLCRWQNTADFVGGVFARQAISMIWDFAEANPFSNSTANWAGAIAWIAKVLQALPTTNQVGVAGQFDSAVTLPGDSAIAISTDPPYYDNISYADIADFFYVWLRRSIGHIHPTEFSTLATPKAPELVATPFRFDGDQRAAEAHFEQGLMRAFSLMRERSVHNIPMTVFYAYKQTENKDDNNSDVSTGWETMLSGLISSGFVISGTWPMRTELGNRLRAQASNALATSVVLVCRPRPKDASMADIGEFRRSLASELPEALKSFIGEHIAPVDLPQASIGPGMAVFSRYSAVVRPNGDHMTVREALELINAGVEQFFSEREGAFDGATQFCLRWFEQFGFEDGPFGDADTMARAKDISVEELQRDGLLTARRGRVQLLPFERYEATWESWEPSAERRLSAWRACHYLAAALEQGGVFGGQGEHDAGGAALLARELSGNGEQAKELAYRLYAICDAKGWASEARRYNALADAWSEISAEAGRLRQAQQGRLG